MYDVEKEDRWYEATIWIMLAVILGLVTLLVLVLHVKEFMLVHNGERLTLPYKESTMSVSFRTDDQHLYYVNFNGFPVKAGKDSVNIYYYKGKEAEAKPQTATWFWVTAYGVFVPLLSISINRIYVHLKKPHYLVDSKV